MNPEFGSVVERLISNLISLLEDMPNRPESAVRQEVLGLLENASRQLSERGLSEEWNLAVEALIYWFDSAAIGPYPNWVNNPIEVKLGGSGVGGQEFFSKAKEAGERKLWDALEVYFYCFLMGFRGIYEPGKENTIPRNFYPTGEIWQRETAKLLSGNRYRPSRKWASTLPLQGSERDHPMTGEQEVTSTAIFFGFGLTCLLLALWLRSSGLQFLQQLLT